MPISAASSVSCRLSSVLRLSTISLANLALAAPNSRVRMRLNVRSVTMPHTSRGIALIDLQIDQRDVDGHVAAGAVDDREFAGHPGLGAGLDHVRQGFALVDAEEIGQGQTDDAVMRAGRRASRNVRCSTGSCRSRRASQRLPASARPAPDRGDRHFPACRLAALRARDHDGVDLAGADRVQGLLGFPKPRDQFLAGQRCVIRRRRRSSSVIGPSVARLQGRQIQAGQNPFLVRKVADDPTQRFGQNLDQRGRRDDLQFPRRVGILIDIDDFKIVPAVRFSSQILRMLAMARIERGVEPVTNSRSL